MSHACRGIRAFAHAIVFRTRVVLHRTSPATAIAIASALLLSAAPASAVQPGAQKFEMPLNQIVTNSCTGEQVQLTGTQEFFFYIKTPNGTTQFTTRVRTKGTGVSLTDGTTYTYHSEENLKFGDLPPGDVYASVLNKTMLIRHGELVDHSPDDWMFKVLSKVRITETNTVEVNNEVVGEPCPIVY
jgi:hypothetical protein